jgi:hypothetical protein
LGFVEGVDRQAGLPIEHQFVWLNQRISLQFRVVGDTTRRPDAPAESRRLCDSRASHPDICEHRCSQNRAPGVGEPDGHGAVCSRNPSAERRCGFVSDCQFTRNAPSERSCSYKLWVIVVVYPTTRNG